MDSHRKNLVAALGTAEDALMAAMRVTATYRDSMAASGQLSDWDVEQLTSEIGWLETEAGKVAEMADREAGR